MGDLVPEAEVVYYPSIIEEGGGDLKNCLFFGGEKLFFEDGIPQRVNTWITMSNFENK